MPKEDISQSPIKGLTVNDVDWSLYGADWSLAVDREKRNWTNYGSHLDLLGEAVDFAREHSRTLGEYYDTHFRRFSDSLKDFLKQNRPGPFFFDPAEVASHLTPESSLKVEHERTESAQRWLFCFNQDKSDDKSSICIERGQDKRSRHNQPYIVVYFSASYDGLQVIFKPRLKNMTPYGSFPSGEFETEFLSLLGIGEHRVVQNLKFGIERSSTTREELIDGEYRQKTHVLKDVSVSLA